jgi:hypothetical protein
MKTRKLITKLYEASLEHNQKQENKLYQKLLQKSLKNKNTTTIR